MGEIGPHGCSASAVSLVRAGCGSPTLALPPPPAPQVSHITVVIVCNNLIDDYLTPIRQIPIPWLCLKLYRKLYLAVAHYPCCRLCGASISRDVYRCGGSGDRYFHRGKEEATTDVLDVKGNSVTCTNNHHTISHDPIITATSNGTQGFRKGYQYAQHPTCIPSPNPRSLVAAQLASNAKCNAMQVNQYITPQSPSPFSLQKRV